MGNAVCIGAQWGDEGKGRIVDRMGERADVVVRFHGGNNAGHTVVVDGVTTILHLVPSGVLHAGKLCVIGAGCVVDPEVLLQEMDMLAARGLLKGGTRVIISDQAHVILPYHKRIDKAREASRGRAKIGTTGRGIGPTYEDKAARRGLRMHDLIDPVRVAAHVRDGCMYANSLLDALDAPLFSGADIEEMIERMRAHGARMAPLVDDAGELVSDAAKQGKRILFEGAQGALLDLDHGTYPYVTSSNCLASHAAVGTGVGPQLLGRVLGVAKAYATRVGEGPFPTELAGDVDGPLGEKLRKIGNEFGATTGRPRRTGWLDLVALRYAVRLNGITDLALTKLDVLSAFGDVKVCVAYEIDGVQTDRFPHDLERLSRAKPVFETFPGFSGVPDKPRSLDDLPREARNYVEEIAKRLDVRLSIVAAGPGRGQEIMLHDPMGD